MYSLYAKYCAYFNVIVYTILAWCLYVGKYLDTDVSVELKGKLCPSCLLVMSMIFFI